MIARLGKMLGAAALASLALSGPAQSQQAIIDQTSIGPDGGNGPHYARLFSTNFSTGADRRNYPMDGSTALFNTADSLLGPDLDDQFDVYSRSGGATALVSTGSTGGNAPFGTANALTTPDGDRVFFETYEPLVPEDDDGDALDVYERTNGVTTLVTVDQPPGDGTCLQSNGSGPCDMFLLAVSDDGSHVFFSTGGSLVPGDTGGNDTYERHNGQTRRVSLLGGILEAISADGTKALFTTPAPWSPADTDNCPGLGCRDLYLREGNTTTLLSTGPTGTNANLDVFDIDVSVDGAHAFFSTAEPLVAADADGGRYDIYEHTNGGVQLVSAGGNGPFSVGSWWYYISDDGTHAAFLTAEPLDAADTDSSVDLYERVGGATVLVSTGPAGGNGAYAVRLSRVSRDGSHIFFSTGEQLTVDDTDSETDIYVRGGGTTRLVSTGPQAGPPCVNPENPFLCEPSLLGVSRDGSRAVFISAESLVSEDTDSARDIYVREDNATTLVSAQPDGGTAFDHSTWVSISDDGGTIYFESDERLRPTDTDSVQDVYRARVPTGYARPNGARSSYASLVPTYPACTNPDRTHGPPLAFGSCSSPQQASQHLTVGTPDANGKPAKAMGFVRYDAIRGLPSTPADEADTRFTVRLDDVRLASDLTDYDGELELRTEIRITDRASGPGTNEPATVQGFDFPVAVPCATTADATIGAHCGVMTSAEAIMPGAVREGTRSVWALGQARVYDGGPDGVASTQDNTLFAVQGLFVP